MIALYSTGIKNIRLPAARALADCSTKFTICFVADVVLVLVQVACEQHFPVVLLQVVKIYLARANG